MKNQYFGDVGDYGKYGLLKFLAEHDVRIAVNWYLTEKDDRPGDGRFTEYLEEKNERKYSEYDHELFATLKSMLLPKPGIRDVEEFELKKTIPGAIYYHEMLNMHDRKSISDRKAHRSEWHKKALDSCKNVDFVFLDPDNGPM